MFKKGQLILTALFIKSFKFNYTEKRGFVGDALGCGEYCVYIHINKINQKKYIGLTCQKPEKRWNNGNGYINDNPYLGNAIMKNGWNSFKHEILVDNLSKEKAEQYEIALIKQYETTNRRKGYNISYGGNAPMKGRTHTKETIDIIRAVNKGKNNYNSKKTFCDDMEFECIGDCAKFYNIPNQTMISWLNGSCRMPISWYDRGLCVEGKTMQDYETHMSSEEIGKKMSENHADVSGEKNPKAKKVICDNIIYGTMKQCADGVGIHKSTLYQWLSGRRKMPKRFVDLGLSYYNECTCQ